MKQLLLALFIGICPVYLNAQSFLIEDDNHTDVTGGLIIVNGDNDQFGILQTYAAITNISGTDMDVKVKRYETSVVSGSENYFCWYLCYGSLVAGTKPLFPEVTDMAYAHLRTIESDSTDKSLAMYHKPVGTTGTSVYRYVVFDANNPTDSAYVDVQFNVGSVGVNELTSVSAVHYPNPASSVLTIKLDKVHNNLMLNVVDMLGKRVEARTITNTRIDLDVSAYKNGIYFYSIENSRGILVTRKFIVSK